MMDLLNNFSKKKAGQKIFSNSRQRSCCHGDTVDKKQLRSDVFVT